MNRTKDVLKLLTVLLLAVLALPAGALGRNVSEASSRTTRGNVGPDVALVWPGYAGRTLRQGSSALDSRHGQLAHQDATHAAGPLGESTDRVFAERTIKGTEFSGAISVDVTDLDGDGDTDVLGAARTAGEIAWWENDGSEHFTQHVINGDFDGADSVCANDVDGDGDTDVLGAAYTAGEIAWWENDGSEHFTQRVIKDDFDGASSVYASDVDGDGDVDVVGAATTANEITWWENDGSESFSEHLITGDFECANSVHTADVDGDGDIDVLGAAFCADDVAWWENDGSEHFTEHVIKDDFDGAWSVCASDVDGDGDTDVLGAAHEGGIMWWENDGSENFAGHTIQDNIFAARRVYAIDLDSDGDRDVLGAAAFYTNDIRWWENDGDENFVEHVIKDDLEDAGDVTATDLDGDGDIDVVGAASHWSSASVTWWENDGSQGFAEHTITGAYYGALGVYATDVDGDGDADVLGTAYDAHDITWWENDGNQNFTEHVLDDNFYGAYGVYALDMDDDGDVDVLGSSGYVHPELGILGSNVSWWENDGSQTFSRHTIRDNYTGARGIYAIDLDGDTDVDVLGTSLLLNDLTWWENDGTETFVEHIIDGNFSGAIAVYAADVDGDGDVDVLGAANYADDITWWENDGSENFTKHTIKGDFDCPRSVFATDLDDDGDVDVLGTAVCADDITWWENDGSETFTEHTIDGAFNGATSVYATDVDGDGDADVLGAAAHGNELAWWEAEPSGGAPPTDPIAWTKHTIIAGFAEAENVYAIDVDGDGDTDVLGTAQQANDIAWFQHGFLPAAPTNLEAVAVSATQIDLAWQDNSTDESDFHVERSPTGVDNWLEVGTAAAETTTYEDPDLSCATMYWYRVRAHRHGDDFYSLYSNTAHVATPPCPESIWYVSTFGNDDNDCQSWSTPCRTIGHVVEDRSHGGDLILIGSGSYHEHLAISKQLTIHGAGRGETIIDGASSGRVFEVGDVTLALSGVTIQNGSAASTSGGGIETVGTLTLSDCDISSNAASAGGGIYNTGTLVVLRTSIRDNGGAWGGGIRNNGICWVIESTIHGHNAGGGGGGIYHEGGTLMVENSTISGNVACSGGGIDVENGTCTLHSSTIAANTSTCSWETGGGGICAGSSAVVRFSGTLVADNVGDNCWAPWSGFPGFVSDGHNLESGDTCHFTHPNDLVNTDPLLGPLADNGGQTLTHALLAGSPAIDAGDPAVCPATDQRGVKRPLDGDDDGSPVCDIGAYEASDPPPSAPTSLTALSISETQINLSWDDESDDESDFHIERAIASIGNWEDVAAVPPDTEAYEDNRLQCGTSYQYRVRAHRGTDNQFSAYSNVSAADTGECPPPNAPTNLAALAASASCIDLTWQDQSEDESSFRIERSPGGAHTWVEIDTVPADTECHQDSGLQCGTSYDYRVRAYRVVDGTFSDYSNVAGETTFACPPPAAPADLTAEPVSDRQIALSWNDLSGDESDFHVERSLTGTGSWTEIGTAPLDSEAYQDVGLLRHTTYFYRVRAHRHSDDQFSAYGNVATATTYAAFYLPCALKGY